MSDPAGHDYGVGYAKPPAATRFSKGQSGNPKGRPRGSKNMASILDAVTKEMVRVTENGKVRTISKLEAIMRQLTSKALSGDLKAIKDVLALRQVCEAVTEEVLPENPDTEKNQAIMRRLIQRIRNTESAESDSVEPAVQTQKEEDTK